MGRSRSKAEIQVEPEPVTVEAAPAPVPEVLTTKQILERAWKREYHGRRPPLLRKLVKWGSATD
jgi:hypothetical protein